MWKAFRYKKLLKNMCKLEHSEGKRKLFNKGQCACQSKRTIHGVGGRRQPAVIISVGEWQ